MTGVPPSGSGHSPKGGAAKASPAKPSVPNAAFTPGPWCLFDDDDYAVYAYPDGIATTVADTNSGSRVIQDDDECAANARLIAAAPKLYEALEHAVAFLRAAPLESGVCCCGNPIEGHGYGDGHSPVDELQYHAGGLGEKFAAVLAKARGEQ